MKVLLLMVLSFVLLLPMAHATSLNLLDVIQKYQYAIDIEWDQHDPEFLNFVQRDLEKDLGELLNSGTSPEELLNQTLSSFTESESKNEILNTLILARHHQIGAQELRDLILGSLHPSQQGASWNGVGYVAVGIVGTMAVLYIATRVYFYEWGKRL